MKMTTILNAKVYNRKKTKVATEHKINGRELMEAINSIANANDIDSQIIIDQLKTNIIEVLKRKSKELKYANISVELPDDGNLCIYRIYQIVPEYSSTYEQNCTEVTLEDISEIQNKFQDNQSENVIIHDNIVKEKLEFKFERKLFEDLRNLTKGKISTKAKEVLFHKLKEELQYPVSARIYNIKKKTIYIKYKELDILIPFDELNYLDKARKEKYAIGEYINVLVNKQEKSYNNFRVFGTRNINLMVSKLFEKYNDDVKDNKFKVIGAIPMKFKNENTFKLIIEQNPKIKLDKLNQSINGYWANNIKLELGLNKSCRFFYLVADNPITFIIQHYHYLKLHKIFHDDTDGVNQYTIIVNTEDDKKKVIKGMKSLKSYLDDIFGMTDIFVQTIDELSNEEKEVEEETINLLMSKLNINHEVAELLYLNYFDSIEIIAYAAEKDFDVIKDELATLNVDLTYLRNKAKDVCLSQAIKEQDNLLKTKTIFHNKQVPLTEEQIEVLNKASIQTIESLADLSSFELMEIIPDLSEDEAKQVILKARS